MCAFLSAFVILAIAYSCKDNVTDKDNVTEQKPVSLKGEVTTLPTPKALEKVKAECKNCDFKTKGYKVYSINMNAQNVGMIERKINVMAKNVGSRSKRTIHPERITLWDGYYIESQRRDKPDLIIVLVNQAKVPQVREFFFAKTDGRKLTSDVLFYHAETNVTRDKLLRKKPFTQQDYLRTVIRGKEGKLLAQRTSTNANGQVQSVGDYPTGDIAGDCTFSSWWSCTVRELPQDGEFWYTLYCRLIGFHCILNVWIYCGYKCAKGG